MSRAGIHEIAEPVGAVDDERNQSRARARIASLAHVLDSSIRLPGGFRIGLDGLVGLVPGVGDLAGILASGYLVVLSARAGVSRSVQLLMIYNILIEAVVGAVPIIGDVFDFIWKANEKNLALYDDYMANPDGGRGRRRVLAAAPIVLFLGVVALAIAISTAVVKALFALVQPL